MNPTNRRALFAVALLAIVCASIFDSFRRVQAADGDSPAATYTQGTLHVSIPYRAPHAGLGKLTVEVLDPEDHVLGSAEHALDLAAAAGHWQEDLKLTKTLAVEDLVWHRVRYRFTYAGGAQAAIEGVESISQILRTPVIHVLGQRSYLSGGVAAVRVIVADSHNEPIAGPGSVRIELTAAGAPARPLFTGRTNRRGSTEVQFRLPPALVGTYSLHYVVDTPIGSSDFSQQVLLENQVSILVTTEKPIYQPGQTIHVRALALDRANHEAAASHPLTFEIEDPRGNKVFRSSGQTDAFGVASAEFSLADEVNLGTYHLRAIMDARNTAELSLNVERYVLPRFKVAVDFTAKNEQTRHGYRPGDHVTGTVRANYFFGKPVDHADITVKAIGMDVAQFDAGSTQGITDAEGAYRFDIHLPTYLAGRPLSHGAARVLVEATVKDSAGHSETRGEPVIVSQSPLLITAVPEGGTLIPTLENQVFILTSYPDGAPAATILSVNGGQRISTDDAGVAVIRLPGRTGAQTLKIEAGDRQGNQASTSVELAARNGADQILLRTEHAVYRAGESIMLHVFSTRPHGTAYLDIVKEGQTVLTRDVEMVNGQADLALTATPDLAGALDCNAYLFGADAQPIGDHRLLFVQPADELKIEATADNPVYRPGDDARIRFRVTNSKGQGVQAALGVQVVDEAVFALAEKQPGFAKVFFYLEQEVMKPRYEIHSLGMPEVITSAANTRAAQKDLAARALFSATEVVNPNRMQSDFGESIPLTRYAQYAQRFEASFLDRLSEAAPALGRDYEQNGGDFPKAVSADLRDAWNTAPRVERQPWYAQHTYAVRSAGPDKRFDTPDDLVAYLNVRAASLVGSPGPNSGPSRDSIDFQIESDRGPNNGLSEITGTVTDPTGAFVTNATITLREIIGGKTRTARANDLGQFSFAALTPGDYGINVYSPGFRSAYRELTVCARDRAVLAASLKIGAMTQVVEVTASAAILEADTAAVKLADGPRGKVANLPLVNRNAVDMLKEQPKDAMAPMASPPPAGSTASPAPHVRSYFPEALYINPEIITDHNGAASISIPLADSITTWRMALMASTAHGALGTGTSGIKVFQDFFTELDLPVTLTQGDRVSIPVAVYNYSGAAGNTTLELQSADWFRLSTGEVATKTLTVESGRVGGSQFTIEAARIGKFKLTLSARMTGASNRADIVVREIEVLPNGREQTQVFNGRLDSSVDHQLAFPAASIAGASKILVRLYPGPLSQVIEGMDSILRMPGGCFEQTSSSTYPNVLALDYMKRTGKLAPEVHAKAEGFISNGYQRLLTFEVPGGGFSWFGQAPANKILTAYGLMEFSDMSKVHDVDRRLIERTQQWLAQQQQPDGSWKSDTNFINEGATNRFNSDVLRITAYIAWSLGNTGYQGPAVEKARQYIAIHMDARLDPYTLAVLANFAVDYAKDRASTHQAIELLLAARTEKDDQMWWDAPETAVYSTGVSAAVETTGLAAQALLKSGESSAAAGKALRYLASKKDSTGAWGTTQATIMALRAVLLSTEKGAADVRGAVEISLDGKPVQSLTLTADNNDLLHQFVYPVEDAAAAHSVALRFSGKGGLAYQVVGRYFLPWNQRSAREPLSIDVHYDRTQLAQNDIATATATIRNNLNKPANMVMVDLGIPPGFDLLSEDLQDYQAKSTHQRSGRLQKFTQTATQAILYFDSLAPNDTTALHFRLRAKYPIRAQTFPSRVYEYYDPAVSSVARPIQLEVKQK